VVRLIDTHNVVSQKSKKSKCFVIHKDKLKACIALATENSATQPATPAALHEKYEINEQKYYNETREINDKLEEVPNGIIAAPLTDNLLRRPKRDIKVPKRFNDFIVCAVFRSNMASQMVHQARYLGLVCEVCNKGFSRRHGLKYHLQTKLDDPEHANYARRELDSWLPRGQYRSSNRQSAISSLDQRDSGTRNDSSFQPRRYVSRDDEHCRTTWRRNSPHHEQVSNLPRVCSVVCSARKYSRPYRPLHRPH
jgi:hypothetical protein